MKVTPRLTFTDGHRRLVARFLGRPEGYASQVECVAWARQQVIAGLERLRAVPPGLFPANLVIREGESEPRKEIQS